MSGIYVGTSNGIKELKIGKEEVHGEQIFTESGTFTIPDGVYYIDVFLVGGGSAGYYSTNHFNGNYEYHVKSGIAGNTLTLHIPVVPKTNHTIVIGEAGKVQGVTNSDSKSKYTNLSEAGNTMFDDYIAYGGGGKVWGSNQYKHTFDGTGSDWIDRAETDSSNTQHYGTHAFGLITESKYSNENSVYIDKIRTPNTYGDAGYATAGNSSTGSGYISNLSGFKYANGMPGICIIRW